MSDSEMQPAQLAYLLNLGKGFAMRALIRHSLLDVCVNLKLCLALEPHLVSHR